MYIYVYACSDKKRMPTRSRVPDGSKKNADDEGEVDEDEEDGDETSSDDDDCKIVDKKVMKKVDNDKEEAGVAARAVVEAVRSVVDDLMGAAMNVMMHGGGKKVVADDGKDVVMNGGEGEAAVMNDGGEAVVPNDEGEAVVPNDEGEDVVPPVGAAPQGVVVNERNNERDDGCYDGYDGCAIKHSLMVLRGGPLVDVHMHKAEASTLAEDHTNVHYLCEFYGGGLMRLEGMMNDHMGMIKQGTNAVRGKMDNLVRENEGENPENIIVDKMLLQAELLVSESHRKHMEAMKMMLDFTVDGQKGLVTKLADMREDMDVLLGMLQVSQHKADDFSREMDRADCWREWDDLVAEGRERGNDRRREKYDEDGMRKAAREVQKLLKGDKVARNQRKRK